MSIIEGPEGFPGHSLVRIFEATASKFPNAIAVECGHDAVTYRQLLKQAKKLAKRLNAHSIGSGDRVSIQAETGTLELYRGILGVLFSGAAYVPIDHEDSKERALYVQTAAAVRARIDGAQLTVLNRGSGSTNEVLPNSDAWVIFTSGSTGKPKAVAVTHESASNLVLAEKGIFSKNSPISVGWRVAATLSPAFDASIEEMWLAWANGATLIPISRSALMSGPDLPSELEARGINVLSTVPSIAGYLAQVAISSLRVLILGGEAVTEDLVAKLHRPGMELWNTYGPTEATVITTAIKLKPGQPITIGLPIAGSTVAVVSTDGNQVTAFDEVGELVIGGIGLGRYLDLDLDAERFVANQTLGMTRSYKTGDLVRVTSHGYEFVGRKDEQVKVAGKRIDLFEVEVAAQQSPDVREVAAVALKTPEGDSQIFCFVVPTGTLDQAELRASLGRSLPAGIVPIIRVIAQLPLKVSGKVDKQALVEMAHDPKQPEPAIGFVAQQFAKVLTGVSISDDDNFFEIGGTSSRAAKLVVGLRQEHPSATVLDVYRHPTPRLLDVALTKRLKPLHDDVEQVSRTSERAIWRNIWALFLQFTFGLALALGIELLVTRSQGNLALSLLLISLGVACFAGLGRALVAGAIVRILMFGVTSGKFSRNGLVHTKIWTAERIVDLFGVIELAGTPWMVLFARIAGNKIGANCTIESLPPVLGNLEIGKGSSIGRDVHMSGWNLNKDTLTISGYKVGSRVNIANRCFLVEGIDIADGCDISTGSLINEPLLESGFYSGSPIEKTGSVVWPKNDAEQRNFWKALLWISPTLFAIFTSAQLLIPLAVAIAFTAIGSNQSLGTFFIQWGMLLGPFAQLVGVLLAGLQIRFWSSITREGDFPIHSRNGFGSWAIERTLTRARRQHFWVFAGVITPLWLRLCGAKIGRNSEISTVNGQIGKIVLGNKCFLADDSSLALRETRNGWARIQGVMTDEQVFVGNSATIAGGLSIPKGVLISVASVAPNECYPSASFIGIPPIEFPRSVVRGPADKTYRPSLSLKLQRATVEIFRLVPSGLNLMLSSALVVAITTLSRTDMNPYLAYSIFALLYMASTWVAALTTVLAKWSLVGRVKISQHNLWSNFVWRNELFWNFVESTLIPWLAWAYTDTVFHNSIFRMMGARIGKDVSLSTWFLDDPDLVEIGRGSVLMKSVDVQTHLFHDRIMQLDKVHIGANCTIGSGSFVLPGSKILDQSTVHSGSLVPRDETVPPFCTMLGNPVEMG